MLSNATCREVEQAMTKGTLATLALYCGHCGKLHMQELSRFVLHGNQQVQLRCSCGQKLATLSSTGRQVLLRLPCAVCRKEHIVCFDVREFWQGQFEKIYCRTEKIELGYWGEQILIRGMVDECTRECSRLIPDIGAEEYVEDPRVMLEVLNRIHDLAEQEEVYCACGSCTIEVQLLPDGVVLECMCCGGVLVIPASTEGDLRCFEHVDAIELSKPLPYQYSP